MAIKFAPADAAPIKPKPIRTERVKTIDEIKAAVAKSSSRKKPIKTKDKILPDQIGIAAGRGRPPGVDKNETVAIRLPVELASKMKATKDWQKIAIAALTLTFKSGA